MNFSELEIQIKDLIAKDEIEEAIGLLTKYFRGNNRLDDIVLQSGRYHSLRKDQIKGIVDYAEFNNSLNQLRANILSFLKSQEEESDFKSKIFQPAKEIDDKDNIPVFFSLGSPHKQTQLDYIEKLTKHLLKYKIALITLDGDDWNNLDPLDPIRKKMKSCSGCLSLALERSYVKEGINKRGSQQENTINDESFATSWVHIETTLAYQLELPFLILKEKDLKGEGMLDDSLFEWRIIKIDLNNPNELNEYPIKSFIRMWIEEVKKFQSKKNNT